MDLEALRKALAENLRQIDGVQVQPYKISNPTPPTLLVLPAPDDFITYDLAMARGTDQVSLLVELFGALGSDIGAQKTVDKLIGQVKAAAESDKTLGGLADSLKVTAAAGYDEYVLEGNRAVLGCRFSVEVLVTP